MYTVPEEVTFKNYGAEGGKVVTRRLLVRVSEDSPLSKRKIHIAAPSMHRGVFSVKESLNSDFLVFRIEQSCKGSGFCCDAFC